MRDELIISGKCERLQGTDKSEGYCLLSLIQLCSDKSVGYCVLSLIQLCEPALTDKESGDSRNRGSVAKSLTYKDIKNL